MMLPKAVRHDSLVYNTGGSNNECDVLNSNGADSFIGEREVVLLFLFDAIFQSKKAMTLSFYLGVQEK